MFYSDLRPLLVHIISKFSLELIVDLLDVSIIDLWNLKRGQFCSFFFFHPAARVQIDLSDTISSCFNCVEQPVRSINNEPLARIHAGNLWSFWSYLFVSQQWTASKNAEALIRLSEAVNFGHRNRPANFLLYMFENINDCQHFNIEVCERYICAF